MGSLEKPGFFYLGKKVDPATGSLTNEELLYESKNLTTHAVCLGMTGSGKTGLAVSLLEEAALGKIPAIAIDPKGDLGNLLLAFPNLQGSDFKPWVDQGEAERKGESLDKYADEVAKNWKAGLKQWGEDGERIKRYKDSVEMAIYTPASQAGIPLSILSSFDMPGQEVLNDPQALRDRILSLVSSLLGLIGINADPIKSREHILLSSIIEAVWKKGQDLDIATLIALVQKPPFEKVGALDLDTFLPQKERMALSIALNNLLASPGFQAWMQGEPLDIQKLLYGKGDKPRLSILSIAHLSDSERMFFVTLFLNQLISWMRQQSGTSSLRAILYMDEIFGYFPPTQMPPSKLPMLTLLKQARAFGLGVALATQNPVDLDYKGLSNCGSWFIGKLQTERDQSRVLEGLALASNGEITAGELNQMLSKTGNRTFVLRSIHEKKPILFQTRFALSYLRGPLTLPQIALLTPKSALKEEPIKTRKEENGAAVSTKPLLAASIREWFMRPTGKIQEASYHPKLYASAKLHFVDSKLKVDTWKDFDLLVDVQTTDREVEWDKSEEVSDSKSELSQEALPNSRFDDVPNLIVQEKNYPAIEKSFALWLYQTKTLELYREPKSGQLSTVDESEEDFKKRVSQKFHSEIDSAVQKIRDQYDQKINTLDEKIKKKQDKASEKKQRVWMQWIETALSILTAIAGMFVGRRGLTKTTINQAGGSLKKVGKIGKDSEQADQIENDLQAMIEQKKALEEQLDSEIKSLESSKDLEQMMLEKITVRPRKSDIAVQTVGLLWTLK